MYQIVKNMLYRATVIESLQLLEDVRNQVFTQIVNIASQGEMKDILEVFEEGDSYTFDIDQFDESKDINIVKLLRLCKNIEEAYESIQNVNAVRTEELIIK